MAIRLTKRHKFNAKAVTIDGHRFDSIAESARYGELRMLEKAGRIWDLELQPKFPLCVPSTSGYLARAATAVVEGGQFRIGEYRADFKYQDGRTVPCVVEDVKGVKTAIYRWKKKHVEAQYGIEVVEIGR